MDETEKEEYENLNKKNNQNEFDKMNIINNEKKDNDIDGEKLEENGFIDLRNVLSEEKFNEAKKDIFFQ